MQNKALEIEKKLDRDKMKYQSINSSNKKSNSRSQKQKCFRIYKAYKYCNNIKDN